MDEKILFYSILRQRIRVDRSKKRIFRETHCDEIKKWIWSCVILKRSNDQPKSGFNFLKVTSVEFPFHKFKKMRYQTNLLEMIKSSHLLTLLVLGVEILDLLISNFFSFRKFHSVDMERHEGSWRWHFTYKRGQRQEGSFRLFVLPSWQCNERIHQECSEAELKRLLRVV